MILLYEEQKSPSLDPKHRLRLRVEILKNGRVAHTTAPRADTAKVQWTDPQFASAQSCWYHVHVVQAGGEEALSSPVWVN